MLPMHIQARPAPLVPSCILQPISLRTFRLQTAAWSRDREYFQVKPYEEVSSLQNATVKHCVKVRTQRAYRQSCGTVLITGADLVHELAPHSEVQTLFVVAGADIPSNIDADRVMMVSEGVMQKVTGLESVNESTLAAELVMPLSTDFAAWQPGQLQRLLVLERCQDPGNMGALLLPGCADPMNDKSLRASRGAPFRLPIAQASVQDWLDICDRHALTRLAAEPHPSPGGGGGGAALGANHMRLDTAGAACLVLGSEGQGLSPEVAQLCVPVAIPMPGEAMESLNVAVAGSILMFVLSSGAPKLYEDLAQVFEGSKGGGSGGQ